MDINPSPRNVQRTDGPGGQPDFERRHQMSDKRIHAYRARMLELCPQFGEAHLTKFVQSCFASTHAIMAYGCLLYLPAQVTAAGKALAGQTLLKGGSHGRYTASIMPFQAALNAAHWARRMEILEDETEYFKRQTALATLLSACGLFLMQHPNLGQGRQASETAAQAAHRCQDKLIGQAVAVLNEQAPDAGKLLSFTLGIPYKGGVDGSRATKMATAVMLSTLTLRNLWLTNAPSLPHGQI